MCRRPIYFKGFKKVEEQWNKDAWETKCADAFEATVETTFENLQSSFVIWPPEFHAFFRRRAIKDLVMAERMFACLKECGFAAEEIDYLLNETDLYYSKAEREFKSEPVREKAAYTPRVNKGMRFKKNNVR
jgi:predicted RNA-binding protein